MAAVERKNGVINDITNAQKDLLSSILLSVEEYQRKIQTTQPKEGTNEIKSNDVIDVASEVFDSLDDTEIEELKQTLNDDETVNVYLWSEAKDGHYTGCQGHQSYSFAMEKDIVIGYNFMGLDQDWFLWFLDLNNLSPLQFYWIQKDKFPQLTDFCANDFLIHQISVMIKRNLTDNSKFTKINLRPFMQEDGCDDIIEKIQRVTCEKYGVIKDSIIGFIANKDWYQKFGIKACLHRYISDPSNQSLFEKYGCYDIEKLSQCRGYVCKNKEDILAAYTKLTSEIGHKNVVIKDCYGCGGDDIFFCQSKQDIDNFKWEERYKLIEIEEDLRYGDNGKEVKKIEFVGITFEANQVQLIHEQIISGDAVFEGSSKYENKETSDLLRNIS